MMRWFGYVIGCFVAGVVALNLYFFAAIASWQVLNPASSAFMRAERMRLCGANFVTCGIDHRWVPYDQISRNLKRAVIASEDADFVSHSGWEVDAMLDAWEKNKRRGHVVAGGSTITQQLAKNLFLSGERHYLRKGEELLITWMLEFWLDKERILEIYLNSVEWGEGIFGAEAAAQHYFKRPASQLTVGQAARLAAAPAGAQVFRQEALLRQRPYQLHAQGDGHRQPDGVGDAAGLIHPATGAFVNLHSVALSGRG